MSKADDDLLKQARDRFTMGWDADANQREREKLSLKMYALEQWEDTVLKSRGPLEPSGKIPGAPARPCLVLDMLREPVHQIVNQEREADLSVELVAADDFGPLAKPIDPSEIELREGLIRRIQRESESASARTWGFTRAVICGRGYYAINTRYAKGETFDQDIYCRRIYDQSGVVLDPAHEEPDGSDAEWGFIFTVMSYDAYKAEYPRVANGPNRYTDCSASKWDDLIETVPGWFTEEKGPDDKKKYVRVAEYWYTERTSRVLCELPDGSTVWKDKLPDGVTPKDERPVVEKSIKMCKIDGCQVLDETDWPSPYIPIVKIVGNEIPPCDQERRVDGVVNKSAIESQRGRNYMGSGVVEQFGVQPISPLMYAEGTIEGYEHIYAQANTRAFFAIPYKPTDLEGRPAPPPFRPDKSVAIGQYAQGLQIFTESIQSSTNVSSPQMGRPSRFSETWRGTEALIAQGQRGTSNYIDNFTRSVRYEGRIMNSLLRATYGRRPGRLTRIMKGEGEAETVPIGQPFQMQDNGQGQQRPVPAPVGATAQTEGVREYLLTEAGDTADVAVKVTKGYDTRRDEEAVANAEILSKNPALLSVGGDLFYGSQDWPGSKEWAERMKVMLDPKVLALLEQKKGGQAPIPPMALQQMQQMQQQLQETTQAAQQMQQELKSRFQETQLKIQSDQQLAQLKAQTEIELARMKLENERLIAEAKLHTDVQTSREKDESAMNRSRLEHAQAIEQAMLTAATQSSEQTQEQV